MLLLILIYKEYQYPRPKLEILQGRGRGVTKRILKFLTQLKLWTGGEKFRSIPL